MPLAQLLPWVRAGLVLEGEISTMFAELKTCCIDWATPEFSGPMAAITLLSATSAVAFCWPVAGCALSSRALVLKVTPGTSFLALASSTAIFTPYWMPRPVAEFWPVSGASTPMVTVVPEPPPLSPPLLLSLLREPQAVRVRAPVASTEVSISKERCCTVSPFPWRGRL